MNIKVLIADDELAPRSSLRDAIFQSWPKAQLVAQCEHGIDAWDSYLEHEPAVCFFDMKMPGLSGFEVAKRIMTIAPNCIVVFCTAYSEYALDAFNAGAIDYLLKPLDRARFDQTVTRIQTRLASVHTRIADQSQLTSLINQALAKAARTKVMTHIQASVGKEIRLIDVQNILLFESDSRYTRLLYRLDKTAANQSEELSEALIRMPLKELLVDLDTQEFWQIHRSTIVNRRYISSAVRIDEGVMNLNLLYYPKVVSVSRQFQGLFKGQ